jgi:hypothetical protein
VSPRSLSVGIAVIGLCAAATLFVIGSATAPHGPPEVLVQAVGDIDGALRERAAGLHSRATTLADLPRLAAAVATDAVTVQDLTQEELAFRLKPGETIEIAQVKRGGQVVSLLRIPKGATAAPALDRPGVSSAPAPGGIELSEVVTIKPLDTKEIERGALAVSSLVDTQPFVHKLEGLGLPALLELGGKTVAATAAPVAAGAETVRVPLGSEAAAGGVLIAEAPAPPSTLSALRIVSIAVAVLAFLVAGALWRRRAAGEAPLPTLSVPPSPAMAAGASMPVAAQSFGRYQLVRKVGSGGMAEVYLARIVGEAGFAKEVALKIMHKSLAQNPEVVDHFLDEARLATRLNHPNIVQIIDLGKHGDDYYIAMDYIDGYDLDYLLDSCKRRGVSVPARIGLAITRKVCDGLHAAHTAIAADGSPMDLVHRDVKAENVLISRTGEVKIADFGIAKANQRARQTQLGVVKGTAAYMAPEHRIGKPVDRRADVYGVGAILYEIFAGTEINLDLEALAHLGVEGWPHLKPLSELRTDVPADIDKLVFTALAYNRDDRYASCAAFEDAIDDFATRHGLVASEKSLVQWLQQEIAALAAAS